MDDELNRLKRIDLPQYVVDRDDHACYASTGGSFGGPQAQYISRAFANMGPGATVVIATDNDDAGEKLAVKIADLAGRATVIRDRSPVGKDWNDCLQEHERDYIESLRSRSRGPER
jgi:DNA primase